MTQGKMDKKQLDVYKKALLKLKEDFVRNIRNMAGENASGDADSRDVSGHVMHMADVATDMYDREFNMGLAATERELLQKVEIALKRIEDKSYGVCVGCNKPIAVARIKAIPYVETCLKCQEKIENGKR